MSRSLMLCFLAGLVTGALAVTADAQSRNTSSSGNATAGEGLAETGQALSAQIPEMREAPEIRDTQTRGTFVGADTGDLPVFVGADQSGGTTRSPQAGRTGPRSRRPVQPGQQPRQSRTLNVRSTLTLGFPYAPKVSPELGTNVRTCLGRIPNFGKNSSIRVSFKKKVVVLEGTVATKHDRALVLQLAALEPGVINVDNRLEVVGTNSTAPAVGY